MNIIKYCKIYLQDKKIQWEYSQTFVVARQGESWSSSSENRTNARPFTSANDESQIYR